MPLDLRSALPTVPGIPAWGAVAVAAGLTFIGFLLDAFSGSELTATFSVLYFLGCVFAVLAVRYRGLFTAVVQPPLLLFVAVPIGQQLISDSAGTSLKDLALTVAYPLVNRFPLMLAATVVVALIAGARVFLASQSRGAPARSRARRATARSPRPDAPADVRSRPRRTAPAGDAHRDRGRRENRREPIRREPIRREASAYREPVSRDAVRPGGYRDTGYREPGHRDTGYREPGYRDTGYREPGYRDTGYREPATHDRDPVPARTAPPSAASARPAPRVRYRDRRDPPRGL